MFAVEHRGGVKPAVKGIAGAVHASGHSLLPYLVLCCYALPYAIRARALREAGRPVPRRRVACFAAGLLALAIALSPPLDHLADRRFAAHMLEHLLIGDVAPLLLVLGCTGPVLAPVLRLRPVRALAGLAHPLVALPLWAGTLYVVHLAVPYDLALRSGAAHAVQHGLFFATGALLWISLVGPLPKPAWFGVPARIAYLTVAWLCSSALGAALVFARSPFYDRYSAGDQSTGGAVMMVEQSVVVLTLLCWLVLQLLERAGEEQELAEVAEAAGVALDPRRAQRAVAAGRGAALRDRLVSGR